MTNFRVNLEPSSHEMIDRNGLQDLIYLTDEQITTLRDKYLVKTVQDLACLDKNDIDLILGNEPSTFMIRRRLFRVTQYLKAGGVINSNTKMDDIVYGPDQQQKPLVPNSDTNDENNEVLSTLTRRISRRRSKLIKSSSFCDSVSKQLETNVVKTSNNQKKNEERAKILVADDVHVDCLLLQRFLENLGHEVRLAKSGKEAYQALLKEDFDIALLDINMPNMSGDEVLRLMMEHNDLQHIPVIMIAGDSNASTTTKCISLGAADYLPKPFNKILLEARVNSCLTLNRRTFERIAKEKERADRLLSVIYPFSVAQELKNTQQVKPKKYNHVAVLCLSIVNFSSHFHEMVPEKVMEDLHEISCIYEDIMEKHGVHKTKTFSDSLMATSGLLEYTLDPVRNCIECGFEMIEVTQAKVPSFKVRIGIHVGGVVAGVIGRRHCLFDVWGDTVNAALQIESYGITGSVVVSKDAFASMQGNCEYEYLGDFDAQDLGNIELYNILELKHSQINLHFG